MLCCAVLELGLAPWGQARSPVLCGERALLGEPASTEIWGEDPGLLLTSKLLLSTSGLNPLQSPLLLQILLYCNLCPISALFSSLLDICPSSGLTFPEPYRAFHHPLIARQHLLFTSSKSHPPTPNQPDTKQQICASLPRPCWHFRYLRLLPKKLLL